VALIRNLVKTMLPYTPGAPSIVLERQLLRAAREFFTKTRAYRRTDWAPILTVVNQGNYDFPEDTEEDVFDLFDFWYGSDVQLTKETRRTTRGRALSSPDIPAYYTLYQANKVRVSPAPAVADIPLTGLVCVRPSILAQTLADDMVDKYMEVLEYGAIAFALRQPHQEWTDYKGAGVYQTLFDDAIIEHRTSAADEEQEGIIRTVSYGGYSIK
jgi:hypothetical protein